MPLPNYGYYNKEKKENQQLKFQMAPEYVDVEEDRPGFGGNGRKDSRKKGRVTTGKFYLCSLTFCSWY